jgi:hypothetical protein
MTTLRGLNRITGFEQINGGSFQFHNGRWGWYPETQEKPTWLKRAMAWARRRFMAA